MIDQTDDYVDSSEACRILGVKPQTLYAYVSRGLVRALGARGKGGLYARADILQLSARSKARSGHGAVAASALRWGEPVLESAITRVGKDDVYYRGIALARLLEGRVSFERVAELMWSGLLQPDEVRWPHGQIEHDDLPLGYVRMSAQLAALAEQRRPKSGMILDDTLTDAREILRSFAHGRHGDKTCAEALTHAFLGGNQGQSAHAEVLINAALVAATDFELSASTFAARIAASTGGSLHACLQAGLAAFSGPAHGAQVMAVEQLLDELDAGAKAADVWRRHVHAAEGIPGFGHKLYPKGDPRASTLLMLIEEVIGKPVFSGPEAELIAHAKKAAALKPNIDLALVLLCRHLKLPRGVAFTLFAMGRMAGWTAHVIEQRQQGYVLRPRAKYIGR